MINYGCTRPLFTFLTTFVYTWLLIYSALLLYETRVGDDCFVVLTLWTYTSLQKSFLTWQKELGSSRCNSGCLCNGGRILCDNDEIYWFLAVQNSRSFSS